MTGRERRKALVADGLCGFCGKPRGKFRFLCDACAAKHRERQRGKPHVAPDDGAEKRRITRDKLLVYLRRVRKEVNT